MSRTYIQYIVEQLRKHIVEHIKTFRVVFKLLKYMVVFNTRCLIVLAENYHIYNFTNK